MSVRAVAERALAAAIIVHLSVAGVVAVAGGPGAEAAAVGLERAQILDAPQVAERNVLTAAQASDPVDLAAGPLPEPATPETVPGPPPPPASAEPPTPAPTAAPSSATETVPPTAPTTPPVPPPPSPAPATSAPATTSESPPRPASSTQITTAGSWRDGPCETAMLTWMNEARTGTGTASLTDDGVVDHVALAWSDHLAATGDLRHNPGYADAVFRARPEAITAGEVVGVGAEPRPIFDEFLRSPTHRDAILRGAFTHATVACVRDASGAVWVTANFWG